MKNFVLLSTLEKLVRAGKLTQAEVDSMVRDRLDDYGYGWG